MLYIDVGFRVERFNMLLIFTLLGCASTPKISEGDDNTTIVYDQDGDGYTSEEDCDDSNPLIFPDGVEQCNGVDDNCDGEVDENVRNTFYLDEDIDGFGTQDSSIEACEAPQGYAAVGSDCDDLDAEVFPGAVEICDGKDNNCDEEIDNGVGEIAYPDADGDGFGDSNAAQNLCSIEEGFVVQAGDCDDSNPQVYSGADEVCDEIDNNCNGEIDENIGFELYIDADSDGFGDENTEVLFSCSELEGYSEFNTDCNDTDTEIFPGALEVCDYIDNDCNGSVDDNASDALLWYDDGDGDGYGGTITTEACEPPSGYVLQTGDCDGFNNTIYPGASEECDGIDNDCNGVIDNNPIDGVMWYEDLDSDGFGVDTSTTLACTQPSNYVSEGGDCDGFNNTIYPGASEECDGIDNDCNGVIDNNPIDGVTWYADVDEDGFGDPLSTLNACSDAMPAGYILDALDCDDGNANVYPDAVEECNSIDDDCNGTVDDEPIDGIIYYEDSDGDGYGNTLVEIMLCSPQTGYEINADDCNDDRADLYPENGMCPSGNDCLDILAAGLSIGDGTYEIDMDGSGSGLPAISVDCDMTTDGGGWTGIIFEHAHSVLSGALLSQGTNVSSNINLSTGPRTRDSGNQSHYYFYEFDYPLGYSEFYLHDWIVRAYAASGSTSEVCGSVVNWSNGLTGHGDIALGSPDDSGPAASMFSGSTAPGCLFSCKDCSVAWPEGTQVYEPDTSADQMRIAWGEYGSQSEGWYPWYTGTLFFR